VGLARRRSKGGRLNIVPAQRTPISAELAKESLALAMPGIDRTTAALLLALVWVETGRGGAFNWNAGSISAGDKWSGAAWRPPWYFDASHPLHAKMLAGQAPSAFRAYFSPTEGFADFVRVIQHSFPSVLEAAKRGDPAAFVVALHDSGYSRDYNSSHVPTFEKLKEFFAPIVASLPGGAGGGPGTGTVLTGAALVGMLALAWAAHREHQRDVKRANRRARREGWLK
jgi:hypothetical protein